MGPNIQRMECSLDLGSWENEEATLEEENRDPAEKEIATLSWDQVHKGAKYEAQREKCVETLGESSEDASIWATW